MCDMLCRYNRFVPWFRCKYVWYPDDDLHISAKHVALAFDIADEYDLLVSTDSGKC